MGKLHSLSGREYLQANEPAARHLFEGVRRYVDLSRSIDMFNVGQRHGVPETRDQADAELRRFQTYNFTVAIFCGGILQVADNGLCFCSRNDFVPSSCGDIVSTDMVAKHAKYCVGREVHGLPLGAYIHAGRNQFAHWGDEEEFDPSRKWAAGFNSFTQAVFDRLLDVHYSHPYADLVYDLGNSFYGGTPVRAADIVLEILQWRDYRAYEVDMLEMIASKEEP